ncbi:hypothetical protein AB0C52_26470 [Streptomyces sp. NPDC048717]|uniref:hypothetical protein n=1 Tax=Streptomyces sp. NPDC048717 TaxID=3154928 RepID=UPI003443BF6B
MRISRHLGRLALAGAMAFAASATTVPAQAAQPLVICTSSTNFGIRVGPTGRAVVVGGLLNCTAPSRPGLNAGSVNGVGTATVNTAGELVLNTRETVTWNDGPPTSMAVTRTITGTSSVVEIGRGTATSGMFLRAIEADTARGTRTNTSDGPFVQLNFTSFTLT